MNRLYLFVFILLAGVLVSGCADNNSKIDTSLIKGDFEIVPTIRSNHVEGEVQMIEFFDFYCSHCYQLSKLLPVIETKHKDTLVINYRPFPLRETSRPPIVAYIVAEKMGKGDEMKKSIFKAYWENNKDIGREDVLTQLAVDTGLDEKLFRDAFRQGTDIEIRENIQLANKYGLRGTPLVIIDGNLKVEPNGSMDAMAHNIDNIITSILAQDAQK